MRHKDKRRTAALILTHWLAGKCPSTNNKKKQISYFDTCLCEICQFKTKDSEVKFDLN